MAISDKLNYLLQTKNLIYQNMKNNGFAITSDMTFREVAEMLSEADTGGDLGDKLYSFGAISDIHIPYGDGVEAFKNTISVLENEGAEFICVSGDIGINGTVSELQNYKNIVDENATIKIYSCTGNHDRPLTNAEWETYVGHSLNYVFEKENDVFIIFSLITKNEMIATENSPYGSDNLTWLQSQFDLYKGRRIFVFTHYPLSGYSGLLSGTYYGFSSTSTEDDTIFSAMNSTKNVIHFSGHTHFLFEVEEEDDNVNVVEMNFNNCATVHIPSSNYPRTSDGSSNDSASQGYLVTVYENAVVLKAMDFVTGNYIDGYTYMLPIKHHMNDTSNALVVSNGSLNVNEGETSTFTVKLLKPIESDVVVNLSKDNENITLDKSVLIFTPENYNIEQSVTVGAVDDELTVDVFSVITISTRNMTNKKVSVTIINNDKDSSGLVWKLGYLESSGAVTDSDTTYWRTEAFPIDGLTEVKIFSSSEQCAYPDDYASHYVNFYSSSEMGTNTFVSRERLTLDTINTVSVPAGASHLALRSVKFAPQKVKTAEEMAQYMYLVQ